MLTATPAVAQVDFSSFFGVGADTGETEEPAIVLPGEEAPIRVEILTDSAGARWANVPTDVAQSHELVGIQDAIDERNNHVKFNADENIGDPRLGEYYFPIVESSQIEQSVIEPIRKSYNIGTAFKPYAFDIVVAEDGRLVREQITTEIKEQLDNTRVDGLTQQLTENPPSYVDPGDYDPERWAQWIYFYQQLTLWERYIELVLLNEPLNQSTSYDIRLMNSDELEELLKSHREQAKAKDERTSLRVQKILSNLEERERDRELFRNWLQARERDIDEFAQNFYNRQQGTLLILEGQEFLVTEKPYPSLPSDVINVVTEELTPFDLLTEDGMIKKKVETKLLNKY